MSIDHILQSAPAHMLLPTVAAIVTAPTLAWVVARMYLKWREWEYRKAEDVGLPTFAQPWANAKAERTPSGIQRDKATKALFMEEHEKANGLQTTTVRSVAYAGSLLFLAFVLFAATVTLFEASEFAHVFTAAFEATAFILVVACFHYGKSKRLGWIVQRTRVEFLRMWQAADYALTGVSGPTLQHSFDTAHARTMAAIPEDQDPLGPALNYGKTYAADIKARISAMPELPWDAALYYVERRPVRQARWFNSAQHRLEDGHRARGVLLFWLFLLAIACAFGKVGLIAYGHEAGALPHVLELALLCAIGASSAVTALMVGQNGRSLAHQYRRQLRDIEGWMAANDWLRLRAAAPTGPLTGAEKVKFADAVEAFEMLMVHELEDWIHATEEDSMELAAA